MLIAAVKILPVVFWYPKTAVMAVMMFFATGSASAGGDAMALILGVPIALLLLISPLAYWRGLGRFRDGDTIRGLCMMALFLFPAITISHYWR